MKLTYLGHSCFLLEARDGTRIVTDPFTGIGYEMPPVEAEYAACSHFHFDHGYTEGVRGVREIVAGAGRHTCGGVNVEGIATFHDDVQGKKRGESTVFVFEADGQRVCHLGDIGQPCSAELVSKIGRADVLLVPVGGTYTVDADGALAYIEALRPRVAVPMHYKCEGCSLDIAPLQTFLDAAARRKISVGFAGGTLECGAPFAGGIAVMERV